MGHFYQQPLSKQSHDYLSYNPRGYNTNNPVVFSYPLLFPRGRSWRRQLIDQPRAPLVTAKTKSIMASNDPNSETPAGLKPENVCAIVLSTFCSPTIQQL